MARSGGLASCGTVKAGLYRTARSGALLPGGDDRPAHDAEAKHSAQHKQPITPVRGNDARERPDHRQPVFRGVGAQALHRDGEAGGEGESDPAPSRHAQADVIPRKAQHQRHDRGRRQPACIDRDGGLLQPAVAGGAGAQCPERGGEHDPDQHRRPDRRYHGQGKPAGAKHQRDCKGQAMRGPACGFRALEKPEAGAKDQPRIDQPPDRKRPARRLDRRIDLRHGELIGGKAVEPRCEQGRDGEGHGGDEADKGKGAVHAVPTPGDGPGSAARWCMRWRAVGAGLAPVVRQGCVPL